MSARIAARIAAMEARANESVSEILIVSTGDRFDVRIEDQQAGESLAEFTARIEALRENLIQEGHQS
jgi:hypothetical protein